MGVYGGVLADAFLLGLLCLAVLSLLIPHHLNHHDGAVCAHAGVEPGRGLAVVLVEDGAHRGVLARYGDRQDGVIGLDGPDGRQLERQAVAAHRQTPLRGVSADRLLHVERDISWIIAGRIVSDLDQGCLGREADGRHLVDDHRELSALATELDAQRFGAQASGDLGEVD